MNILHHLTWKSMKANRTRTLVTVIGILLSAALFCSVTTLAFSVRGYLIDLQIYNGGDYHVKKHHVTAEQAQAIHADDQIAVAAETKVFGVVNLDGPEAGVNTSVLMACNDAYFENMPVRVEEGRLPENSSEVVISSYWNKALPRFGMSSDIGDSISFEVVPYIEAVGAGNPEAVPVIKEYTIVGILKEEFTYATFYSDYNFQTLYTYDDGIAEGVLYSDFYLKGNTPHSAFSIAENHSGKPNTLLLSYYGAAQTSTEQYLFIGALAVVVLIIMIGSSGLIHNAFAVSVSQRAREFGLLSGVGATQKQIRKSVWHEAWILCALGIPVGLLAGYGGMALAISYVGKTIQGMIPITAPGVSLQAQFHPLAFLGAAVISIITVFWSARKPMRKAKKVSPIISIRQNEEITIPAKKIKSNKPLGKSKNIASGLAQKYYFTNRKKFKRVVFSLAMSIVLFLSATTVSGQFRSFAGNRIKNESSDFFVMHPGGDTQLLETATAHSSITRRASYTSAMKDSILPDSAFSAEKLEADALVQSYSPEEKNTRQMVIYYLEDAVLEEYLLEHGIDPEPYLREDDSLALVCPQELKTPYLQTEDGSWKQYELHYQPLAEEVSVLTVVDHSTPEELKDYLKTKYQEDNLFYSSRYEAEENGEIYYYVELKALQGSGNQAFPQVVGTECFLIRSDETADQDSIYSVNDGKVSDSPVATTPNTAEKISLGARIEALPFGIPSDALLSGYACVSVILPLSASEESANCFAIQTGDYLATKNYLDTFAEQNVVYNDYMAEEFQSRSTAQMIELFSYTFLILIAIICAANVFNTVSTNLVLRRRDFGILKSIGMTDAQLRKMVITECLQSGWRALLWGLPIGIGMSVLLNQIVNDAYHLDSVVSIHALLICILCVVITVGISMIYALHTVKEDTPIDAIRMENI